MQKLLKRKSNLPLLLMTFILSISFYACTKLDTRSIEIEPIHNTAEVTSRFFTVPPSTNKITQKVISEIKRRNNSKEFVTVFATTIGYPVWDKAIITSQPRKQNTSSSFANNSVGNSIIDTSVIIPFVLYESKRVHGFIKACINDSINLSYKLAKDYKGYPKALSNSDTSLTSTKFAGLIMSLEKDVFGYTEFKITDYQNIFQKNGNLYSYSSPFLVKVGNESSNLMENMTVCYTVQTPFCNCARDDGSCDMCYDPCAWELCLDYDVVTGGGGPINGGGSGNNGSGNSGGGGPIGGGIPYDPPPCIPVVVNPSLLGNNNVLPGGPLLPCPVSGGVGWDPPILNPLIATAIILDTSITNNFPCVQRIIDSLNNYMSVNAIAQKALHDVFNINKKINTTLKVDWSLTKDSSDGTTREDVLLSNNNSSNNFYATIRLNPWMLKNSTQEYIAATIIHEVFHSYIDYKFYQYRNQIIDSNEYKMLFPLYWPPRVGTRILNAGERRQHNIMATNLIGIMAAPLSSINSNPSITSVLRDSINKALSWGGLQETTIWKTKSDTNDIRAINTFARDTSVIAPFQLTSSGSPFGTIYTNDSHTLHMKKGCQ